MLTVFSPCVSSVFLWSSSFIRQVLPHVHKIAANPKYSLVNLFLQNCNGSPRIQILLALCKFCICHETCPVTGQGMLWWVRTGVHAWLWIRATLNPMEEFKRGCSYQRHEGVWLDRQKSINVHSTNLHLSDFPIISQISTEAAPPPLNHLWFLCTVLCSHLHYCMNS
jgi:hypothetical protein